MQVTICDVGPRDGLQNEDLVLEPAVRAELVNRLAAAGLGAIEAVSFVHPERVPQMAGAEEVVGAIVRRDGATRSTSTYPRERRPAPTLVASPEEDRPEVGSSLGARATGASSSAPASASS